MIVLLAGCAAFNTGSQVQSGRRALLVNDPELALPYFLQAAQADPNYIYYSVNFREGIWTYVGRTQYATKRYAEARESLERALSSDPNDQLARLYLGLTLVRTDDRARGIKEIRSAMRGLYDWLEFINRSQTLRGLSGIRCGKFAKSIEIHLDSGPGNDRLIPSSSSPTPSGSVTRWKTRSSACARTSAANTSATSTGAGAPRLVWGCGF